MMNVDKERGEIEPVMLSEAKHLRGERIVGQRRRCFASLSMTWQEYSPLMSQYSSSRPYEVTRIWS